MATTSGNLTADKAIGGQNGNGHGNTRRTAGLVATVALGLSLLTGVAISQAHPAARPAASQAGGNPIALDTRFVPDQVANSEDRRSAGTTGARIWTGPCRAGVSGCLPGDDDIAPGLPSAAPRIHSGPCRPGGSDCLPDEEIPAVAPLSGGSPTDLIGGRERAGGEGNHGVGPADEYAER